MNKKSLDLSQFLIDGFSELIRTYNLKVKKGKYVRGVGFYSNHPNCRMGFGCAFSVDLNSQYTTQGVNAYLTFYEIEDILSPILVKYGVMDDIILKNRPITIYIRPYANLLIYNNLPSKIDNNEDAEILLDILKQFFLKDAQPFFQEWSDLIKLSDFLTNIPQNELGDYLTMGAYKKAVIWRLCNHPDYDAYISKLYNEAKQMYKKNRADDDYQYEYNFIRELRDVLAKTEPIYV